MYTVKDLINDLKKYPQDLPIGTDYDPFEKIQISIRMWEHTNYPYNKPSFEYVHLE